MRETIKAQLKSLDEAMEACGELAIRLERLAKALAGEQKEEATELGEVADKLADALLGISVDLERSISLLDTPGAEDKGAEP